MSSQPSECYSPTYLWVFKEVTFQQIFTQKFSQGQYRLSQEFSRHGPTGQIEVKVPCNRPEGPRGDRGIALLFLDLSARRGWVVSTTPRPLYPRERPGTHCTGGRVGPRAGLDVCKKYCPPPGFDPWTVQPVASRYTYWAIPAPTGQIAVPNTVCGVKYHTLRGVIGLSS
jgi:hypothetical protein